MPCRLTASGTRATPSVGKACFQPLNPLIDPLSHSRPLALIKKDGGHTPQLNHKPHRSHPSRQSSESGKRALCTDFFKSQTRPICQQSDQQISSSGAHIVKCRQVPETQPSPLLWARAPVRGMHSPLPWAQPKNSQRSQQLHQRQKIIRQKYSKVPRSAKDQRHGRIPVSVTVAKHGPVTQPLIEAAKAYHRLSDFGPFGEVICPQSCTASLPDLASKLQLSLQDVS